MIINQNTLAILSIFFNLAKKFMKNSTPTEAATGGALQKGVLKKFVNFTEKHLR